MKNVHNKNKTLRKEITNLLLKVSIIPILLIIIFNSVASNNRNMEINKAKNTGYVNLIKEKIANDNMKVEEDINFIIANSNIKTIKEDKTIQEIFDNYITVNKDMIAIYLGTEDRKFILSPYEELDSNYDARSREWYKEAISNPEKIVVSKPYKDATNNKMLITYSKAILNDSGEVQGVLGIDENLDELSNRINSLDNQGNDIISIVTEDGIIVADSDSEIIGKNLNDLDSGKAIKMKEAINSKSNKRIYVEVDNRLYYIEKSFDENTKLNIILFRDAKEYFLVYSLQVGLPVIIFIMMMIVIIIAAKRFINNLTNPINDVVRVLKKLEVGDFTESIESKKIYNEEINSMINGVKSLIEDMSILLSGVKESSEKVKEGSVTLFDIISESSNVSEEIAKSVQEIAGGATNQASQLDEGVRIVSDLETEINKSIDSSSNMLNSSMEVKKSSEEGSLAIENLNIKYKENINASNNITKKVDILTEKSNEVGIIISAIKSITEQTNLLALNASIEAARAGEVGRGFAVVAEEIRKLAEESAKSAIQINEVLSEIKGSINELYQDTMTTNKINKETGDSLKITKEKFEVIGKTINYLEGSIRDVTISLDRITISKEKVVNKISEVAAVSQETAAITEEVSAASEEQSSGLQEMSCQAETLKEYAEILNRLTKKFKI